MLWRRLPIADQSRGDFIARAAWPQLDDSFEPEPEFDLVREAINAIRQLRADYAIPPGNRIHASLDASQSADAARDKAVFAEENEFIGRLARCSVNGNDSSDAGASILLSTGARINVPLAGIIDIEKECRKAKTELEKLDTQLTALNARLSNAGFTDRAPAHVVDAERAKQSEWTTRRAQLADKVRSLCGT